MDAARPPLRPMILNVVINEHTHAIRVPDGMLSEAAGVFAKMDADMAKGWQMSRLWVDRPDAHQRCQIVADRLLTAMENGNQEMTAMMAAYLLARMPDIQEIVIDAGGDMTQTRIERRPQS